MINHCVAYVVRKISLPKSSSKIKTSRCFKNFDSVSFRNYLSLAPWQLVEAESDPNKAWDLWKQIFTCIADSNAPLKKKRVRGTSAPWITSELKHDMFKRDRLKKVASWSQSNADWAYYKQQKNKVNWNVKKVTIPYYNNYFKDNSSNIRNT